MKRRLFQSVWLWIVPLLIARALIPTGFMLMAGTDGLQLMLCSGSSQQSSAPPATDQHTSHAGHDSALHAAELPSGDGLDSTAQADDNVPCPFAIATCVAALDVPHLDASSAAPVDERLVAPAVRVSTVAASSAHPIRGPPQFS